MQNNFRERGALSIFVKKNMEFIAKKLDDYVCAHSENEPAVLSELNRKTHVSVLQPRMLSGHFQGRVLSMLSHMIQPNSILEIGTYTGYSAICFAEGLQKNGKIITIDVNEELEDLVREYISKSQNNHSIEYIIGDAMKLIPHLKEERQKLEIICSFIEDVTTEGPKVSKLHFNFGRHKSDFVWGKKHIIF